METLLRILEIASPWLAILVPALFFGLVVYLRRRKAGKSPQEALEATVQALLASLLDEKKANPLNGDWQEGLYRKAEAEMKAEGVPLELQQWVIRKLAALAPTTPEVKP